jgi:hypothetical protein
LRNPKHGYWPVFSAILPPSALSFVNQLSSVTNSIGKGKNNPLPNQTTFFVFPILSRSLFTLFTLKIRWLLKFLDLCGCCCPSGRAWLLLSLNEAVLEAFLATLEDRPSLLSDYYLPDALLRDPTSLQVLITLVSGLEHVGFDFLLVRKPFIPCGFDLPIGLFTFALCRIAHFSTPINRNRMAAHL